MNDVCDLLSCVFGVVSLVQQFSILPGSAMGDTVQVDSAASELRQKLCYEDNSCDLPRRDQVDFTTMSKFAKPEVVGLLIHQGRQR